MNFTKRKKKFIQSFPNSSFVSIKNYFLFFYLLNENVIINVDEIRELFN